MLAIRALDGTQGLLAAGSSAHAGPLICDPDPPYLTNPGYGFHLNSGHSPTSTRESGTYGRLLHIHGPGSSRGTPTYEHTEDREARSRRRRAVVACTPHASSVKKLLGSSSRARRGIFYRIRNSTVRVQPIIWFIPGERTPYEKRRDPSAWRVLSSWESLSFSPSSPIGLLFVPSLRPFLSPPPPPPPPPAPFFVSSNLCLRGARCNIYVSSWIASNTISPCCTSFLVLCRLRLRPLPLLSVPATMIALTAHASRPDPSSAFVAFPLFVLLLAYRRSFYTS